MRIQPDSVRWGGHAKTEELIVFVFFLSVSQTEGSDPAGGCETMLKGQDYL